MNYFARFNIILILLDYYFSTEAMGSPLYISEDQVKNLLNWDNVIQAVEDAVRDISTNNVIQPTRTNMKIPSKDG